jgi:hypothetical protein
MASTFALAPLLLRHRGADHNLTKSDKPLVGSQIMRGAYLNTGSHDAGLDPDWDLKTGTYRGRSMRNFDPTPEQVEEHRRAIAAQKATLAAAAARRTGAGDSGGGGGSSSG